MLLLSNLLRGCYLLLFLQQKYADHLAIPNKYV